MQKLFFIILVCLLCASCGVKGNPEFKSQSKYNKAIRLV